MEQEMMVSVIMSIGIGLLMMGGFSGYKWSALGSICMSFSMYILLTKDLLMGVAWSSRSTGILLLGIGFTIFAIFFLWVHEVGFKDRKSDRGKF